MARNARPKHFAEEFAEEVKRQQFTRTVADGRKPHLRVPRSRDFGSSLAWGLLGGFAATAVMTAFQIAVQRLMKGSGGAGGAQEAKHEPTTVKVADQISQAVAARPIPEPYRESAGNAVHFAFGTLMGGLWGALSSFAERPPSGTGVLFGIGLWLGADEFVLPALGLTQPPAHRELKEHAYEASMHAVYGLCLDAVNQARKYVA